MKKQDIKALVEEYYNGNLTEEEEAILKEYVENNPDEEYSVIREQFRVMDKLAKESIMLDEDFDTKVLEAISQTKTTNTRFNITRTLSGVAATALVLISIWIAVSIMGSKEVYGTVNDPEIAFSETKKALQKVSDNLKKGVAPASKTIDKVDNNIEKSKDLKKASKALKNIEKLNKINSPGPLLKSMSKVTVKYGKS